jgi:hypothetical protein
VKTISKKKINKKHCCGYVIERVDNSDEYLFGSEDYDCCGPAPKKVWCVYKQTKIRKPIYFKRYKEVSLFLNRIERIQKELNEKLP